MDRVERHTGSPQQSGQQAGNKLTLTQRMDRFREWDQERQSVERLMAGSHADTTPYGTREELKAAHDILRKSAMEMARGISPAELREAVQRNEVSREDLVRLDKFIGTFRRRERSQEQDQGPER